MLDKKIWKLVDNNSPGYIGQHKNEFLQECNEKYGKGHWNIIWLVNDKFLEYVEVCKGYEAAYFNYFKKRPELLETLLKTASDVYDYNPSNVNSGLDYLKRGETRTHIQDISIRRCVKRFGRKFEGDELLQIRDRLGPHPLSLALSPGQVPFHMPKFLSNPDNLDEVEKDAWWLPGTVEDFYQRAKRIVIKRDIF